ncbi:MAG: glycosyltransferase [Deltaproteobacteria bacterium]|nr:glycosyltransferase [Deltaproteobacteria bacterium]
MSELRSENVAVVAARWPALARRLATTAVPATHVVAATPKGEPTLAVAGAPLHHLVDPVGDGERWARGVVDRLEAVAATRVVVVGCGLGYHLEALAARFAGGIVVVEPDLAVLRTALATRDLAALLGRVELAIAADDGPDAAAGERTLVVAHAPALLVPDGAPVSGAAYRRALQAWQARAARSGLRLKVLVATPLYGGSWPIAGYAARALGELGHDAHLLDLAPFHDAFQGLTRFGARRAQRRVLEAGFCDVMAAGIAAAVDALEPDLVLALAQAPLNASALEAIGRRGVLRALWFVEDYRVMTYWRELARHYDYVFTIQTEPCLDAMAQVTDARLAYLPCGFDPRVHRPLVLDAAEQAELGSDVSFVGAGYRNRRLAFRRFLDLDFKIWGNDWDGAADLARVLQRSGARVDTEDAVRIFNASKINVNLHSSTYHEGVDPRGDFVNPRTFELAGAGAFQLVDRRALLPPLFAEGRELAVVDSAAGLRAAAEHYLAHEDDRLALAGRARQRALAEHTYARRMEDLLAAVIGPAQERLLGKRRTATVADVAPSAAGGLTEFLGRFDPHTPFAIDRLAASLATREGALSEAEAIFLFLHQFDELYLREQRL